MFIDKQRSSITVIIGALDGWVVTISKPKITETKIPRKYCNRKFFFAIVLQAAVSVDYRFVFVTSTHAGGTHDSTAFQASSLHNLIRERRLQEWAIIVADDAYQILM